MMKISDNTSAQFAQPSPPGWDTLVDVSARLEKSRIEIQGTHQAVKIPDGQAPGGLACLIFDSNG